MKKDLFPPDSTFNIRRAQLVNTFHMTFDGSDTFKGSGILKDFNVSLIEIKCHDEAAWSMMIHKMEQEKKDREDLFWEMLRKRSMDKSD